MNNINKIEIYRELQRELEERKKQQAKPFFSEDYITVEFDAPNNWIYADWKGYQTEGSVKSGCEKILEALIHYKCTRVLNDNTHVVGIWTPASNWVGSNWFPRMEAAGLTHFAWVYSPSRLSQVSTDETLKNTPSNEVIDTFYDIASAKEWLASAAQAPS